MGSNPTFDHQSKWCTGLLLQACDNLRSQVKYSQVITVCVLRMYVLLPNTVFQAGTINPTFSPFHQASIQIKNKSISKPFTVESLIPALLSMMHWMHHHVHLSCGNQDTSCESAKTLFHISSLNCQWRALTCPLQLTAHNLKLVSRKGTMKIGSSCSLVF